MHDGKNTNKGDKLCRQTEETKWALDDDVITNTVAVFTSQDISW